MSNVETVTANQIMKCPFCLNTKFRNGWLTVSYLTKDYHYVECRDCRSLICNPMPDTQTLLAMYGEAYFDNDAHSDRFKAVTDKLEGMDKGVFLDYGCGDGTLLKLVSDLGWKAIGIEFNPDTVKALAAKYQFPVVSPDDPTPPADVLHLGDVIEHLTDIDNQLRTVLERLRPGGTLIAHNPLEGNANMFSSMLKLSRKLRGGRVESVPYHVTLATTKGQKELFRRMGLDTISLEVDEISFPAPYRISEARGPRPLFLYLVRRISQMASRLQGLDEHGNRYMFVGRKQET